MNSKLVKKYRKLEKRLLELRYQNEGEDSPEEDRVLDVMDEIWGLLSEEEKSFIDDNQEPGFTEDVSLIAGFWEYANFSGLTNRDGIPYLEYDVSDSPEVVEKLEELLRRYEEFDPHINPVDGGGSGYGFSFRGTKVQYTDCHPDQIPKVFWKLVETFTGWIEDDWAEGTT